MRRLRAAAVTHPIPTKFTASEPEMKETTMPMSKKDYVLIADTLNTVRRELLAGVADRRMPGDDPSLSATAVAVIDEIGEELGERFAVASPAFNPDTFRAAVRKED